MTVRSAPPPMEDGYALHVVIGAIRLAEVWADGVFAKAAHASPSEVFLSHFCQQRTVRHAAPFDKIRFGISQDALEEMAHSEGLRRVGDLRSQLFGRTDSVLHGLARALVPSIERQEQPSALFIDHVTRAFFLHVAGTYGSSSITRHRRSYGLAPWQLQRAKDRMSSNIDGDPTLSDLADDCGLSPSQFSRAFKQATGISPHQWLTRRRVARARELLQTSDLQLSDIALACGFCDQSHFSRVFSQCEGLTPGKWRRLRSV